MAPGLLIDSAGDPTTDPNVMFADPPGAIRAFGLHKGSGLALICDLLAGALGGGGTMQPGTPRRNTIVNGMLAIRSEEHTSELQSLMRISYAVFCLKKKKNHAKCTYCDTQHTPIC